MTRYPRKFKPDFYQDQKTIKVPVMILSANSRLIVQNCSNTAGIASKFDANQNAAIGQSENCKLNI